MATAQQVAGRVTTVDRPHRGGPSGRLTGRTMSSAWTPARSEPSGTSAAGRRAGFCFEPWPRQAEVRSRTPPISWMQPSLRGSSNCRMAWTAVADAHSAGAFGERQGAHRRATESSFLISSYPVARAFYSVVRGLGQVLDGCGFTRRQGPWAGRNRLLKAPNATQPPSSQRSLMPRPARLVVRSHIRQQRGT